MSKQDQSKLVGVRIPSGIATKALSVVNTEFSGLSEYVRHLIRQDLKRRGLLSDQPQDQAQEVGE